MTKNIDEIIAAYNNAKKTEAAAKKEKDAMSALIIEYAKNAEFFSTDAYNVVIDKRYRSGIDTKKLYKDFPDIKDVYGTSTQYNVITAKEKESAEKDA